MRMLPKLKFLMIIFVLYVVATDLSKQLHHYRLFASSLTFTEEEVYNELKVQCQRG